MSLENERPRDEELSQNHTPTFKVHPVLISEAVSEFRTWAMRACTPEFETASESRATDGTASTGPLSAATHGERRTNLAKD